MTHSEETEIVRQALHLEKELKQLSVEYKAINAETFPTMREEPEMSVVKTPYPDVESDMRFNKWWFLLLLLGPLGWIALFLIYRDFNNNKQRHIERLRNSEPYLSRCREIDELNNQREAEEKRRYDQEMSIYNAELEEHNQKKREWEEDKANRLEAKNSEIKDKEKEMDIFYQTSSLIPLKYHSIFALEYIYNIIGYSQYTFKEAAEDYEIFLNRKVDEAKVRKTEELKQTIEQLERMANDIADSLDGLNRAIKKFTRNEVISDGINIFQQHNRNKIYKEYFDKLKR